MFKMFSKWSERRKLKPLTQKLDAISALEAKLVALTDDELKSRTADFKDMLAAGKSIEDLLPEVLATARDAARRALGLRPYDTQVMGAIGLLNGAILEMGTGEGKTLTAPMAAYACFLQGIPVHVSTANEYLAERDATMMTRVYQLLGMTVGVLRQSQTPQVKQKVYACDVVYGTHHEYAMDYLRDNLARHPGHRVQRALGMVIVDEADAALIDDARTPVTMSAYTPADESVYRTMAEVANQLVRTTDEAGAGDFYIDYTSRSAVLTEAGYDRAAELFVERGLIPADHPDALYSTEHQHLLHRLTSALAAQHMLHKDQHYVVHEGEIILVDALTGRLLPGRRWDSGLQQAMEAKEALPISPEAHTLGSVSLQYYFRMYRKLSGMTGTAMHDAEELQSVYGTPVVVIPPNKPSQRIDHPDCIFATQAEKMEALLKDVQARHANQQPILIGTASIEQSEALSAKLTELGLPHEVLNARQHAREAEIIAQAGRPGAITVSTNMAGRGVDIVLGGNVNLDIFLMQTGIGVEAWNQLTRDEQEARIQTVRDAQKLRADQARQAGGLHIIGLERYESRRMDRQLRGRAGRQGDPGSTAFYLSFEDPLIENFAGEQIRLMMRVLEVKAGDELETKMLMKAVDAAQRQIEGQAAAARKQLMQFDDVLSSQRKAIYELRNSVLDASNVHEFMGQLRDDMALKLADEYAFEEAMPEEWNLPGLIAEVERFKAKLPDEAELRKLESGDIADRVRLAMAVRHEEAAKRLDEVQSREAERWAVLAAIDRLWIAHLDELDQLRKGIHLRGFAKEDPKQAYKKEAFAMFSRLLEGIRHDMVHAALTWYPKT